MTSNRYAAAGWAAILSAAGTLAMLGLSFAFEFTKLVQQGGSRGFTTTIWSAQQVTLVAAAGIVIGNLLADIATSLIDPRVRHR